VRRVASSEFGTGNGSPGRTTASLWLPPNAPAPAGFLAGCMGYCKGPLAILCWALCGAVVGAIVLGVYGLVFGALHGLLHSEAARILSAGTYFALCGAAAGAIAAGAARIVDRHGAADLLSSIGKRPDIGTADTDLSRRLNDRVAMKKDSAGSRAKR
jgi:hypothetical protein